jgi:hypothetical protein
LRPRIKSLKSLDVCRDGGSLSITYEDVSGNHHELIFHIDNRIGPSSGCLRKYKSAAIDSFIKSQYVSPITGIISPDFEKREMPVSWPQAAELLSKLEPYLKEFESEYLWVFADMVTVAGNEEHCIESS